MQLNFEIPLSEIIVDFFDELKSRTKGYASLDYQFLEYRPDELQKLEILVNAEPVDALAAIVHKKDAFYKGQRMITKLKEIIPRQLFDVAIQASAADESSAAPMSKPRARMCWQNVMAATFRARRNCWKNKSAARSASRWLGMWKSRKRPSWLCLNWKRNKVAAEIMENAEKYKKSLRVSVRSVVKFYV